MSHPLTNSVHKFYIPVMGTGFTIDTPMKVARYGISSVISLVDDKLIEQMRKRLSGTAGCEYIEIPDSEEDSRASRITSYLNMMDEMIEGQMDKLRSSLFVAGSDRRLDSGHSSDGGHQIDVNEWHISSGALR